MNRLVERLVARPAAPACCAMILLALAPLAEVWRQSPDLRHGWAAALLMAYLWWERAPERPAAAVAPAVGTGRGWGLAALILALLALPLRLLLTPFPLWTTVLWAYVALLVATVAIAEWRRAGRSGARWFLAPCLLFVSALPWPAVFEQAVIFPLRESMAALAAEVSNLFGKPALAVGTTVRLASGWVGIDEACGGIRSLQACVMIALFFGEWFRFGAGRRALLLAVGVASALAGNFGRVLFLALTAGEGGGGAVERVHDLAAWIALGTSAVATAGLACWWAGWRLPQVAAASPEPARSGPDAGAVAARWMAVCAALLVVNEAGTRAWFALGAHERERVPQWTVALPEAHRSFVSEPLSEPAAEMLQPDGFRAGRWQESGGVNVAAYYVEWRTGQAARFVPFLHNPTVCLPLAGCELVGELGQISLEWNGLEIPFQAYRFTQRGEEMWVAFTIWDPSRAAPLARPSDTYSPLEWWSGRWREVWERRKSQPAQLFTLAVYQTREEPEAALRSRLASLLRAP